MVNEDNRLDLAAVRAKLASAKGKEYWRSLDELAESDGFTEFLNREFPRLASEWPSGLGRRRFLQLMGASLGLAGLSACAAKRPEDIVPYVRQPEEITLGEPLYFATAMTVSGIATGLLVQSREGRPVKIEGNPLHPGSLGATDIFSQASILTLYDPDRSQTVTYLGEISTWSAFLGALRGALAAQRGRQGAGIRILTETISSPTLADQLKNILAAYPAAKWHQWEPIGQHGSRAGSQLAFGEYVNTIYRFDKADVILSLDADFLSCGPASVRYTQDFASRRRLPGNMNRLYAIESCPTNTGAAADHRLRLRPSEIDDFASTIAKAIGVELGENRYGEHADWVAAIVRDLQQHRGSSIVIPGEEQPPFVHFLAHAINSALGNAGATVLYTDPVEANAVDQFASLAQLVQDISAGSVDMLLILGGNPVYTAPADYNFAENLMKVPLRAHLSLYDDETSELCQWHVPEAHYLESWGDARGYDGTVSIVQPLIAPLYKGKSPHEVLAGFGERPEQTAYEIVRAYWSKQAPTSQSSGRAQPGFESSWRKWLSDGIVPNTTAAAARGTLRGPRAVLPAVDLHHRVPGEPLAPGDSTSATEIIFRADPTIHDGRFANNAWLQELPKPLTKLTWDNAAMLSPHTAEQLGLSYSLASRGGEHGQIIADMVELNYQGRTLKLPAWILPGHADGCVTVHLGYGRTRAGNVGTGTGFNAYPLRTSAAPWSDPGMEIRKTGDQFRLACTQYHHNMEGREFVRSASLAEYVAQPDFAQRSADSPDAPSLYPGYEYKGYKWGMAIDLNACVGCNACVVACQSENNIPVVGKLEVTHGREMHWIRIDRYYTETIDDPETHFQPVPCMHCENAPCELVCPVQATVHSEEGLNDMVYNRCVGTRYCSNNCPYKVRRFNFLQFQDWDTPSLKLLRNPEVTVRSRGVMEKCTYCVQRIDKARIQAEEEDRRIRDGDVVTACQAVCPAGAIVFGDLNDPGSRVAKMKADPRNYGLLADLNTRPRTTYMANVRNPNPELHREQ
jgi:MoCo/4Fe-4S cofactor protein with predicted Tat translocation signal